jgi:prolipoprotein diacylglyceryltransferase
MLAIATILSFVWLFVFNKKKLNARWWEIIILCLVHTLYGVLTVKFFALLEAGFNFEKAGSMSLYGGIFLMPIMYVLYAIIKKLPIALVFDVFVISLAFTLALARLGCFYYGCCQGVELGSSGFKWPSREIDLATHVLFIIFIITWIQKEKSKGMAYPFYMLVYGFFRFINEWFRKSDSSSPFHIGHVWSLISIIAGLTIIIVMFIKNKKGENDNEKQA